MGTYVGNSMVLPLYSSTEYYYSIHNTSALVSFLYTFPETEKRFPNTHTHTHKTLLLSRMLVLYCTMMCYLIEC